jgi:hypothetical protein
VRKEWIQAIDRLQALDPTYVIARRKKPERDHDPTILEESKKYLEDFDRRSPTPQSRSNRSTALACCGASGMRPIRHVPHASVNYAAEHKQFGRLVVPRRAPHVFRATRTAGLAGNRCS